MVSVLAFFENKKIRRVSPDETNLRFRHVSLPAKQR